MAVSLEIEDQQKIKELFEYLRWVAERVSRSKFGNPDKIFDLARTGKYPDYIVDLAESFGMMIVKVEAREFGLENNLKEMKKLNLKLNKEIKQKNKYEKALIESEQKLRSVIENIQDGILILQDAKIRYYNGRFAEIIGVDPTTDFTGKKLSDFFEQSNWDIIQSHVSRLLSHESKSEHFMINVIKKDRALANLDWVSSKIEYRHKPATQHTIRDITQRLKLESQLQRAQKLESLGRLTGGIAHNFNNILSVINGYSDILSRDPALPAKCRPFVEEIDAAGKQATALVHQLLSFGKQRFGKLELVSLNRKIADLIQMLQYLIGENIEIVTDLCKGEIFIKISSGQIEQILLNLVLNARDAIRAVPNGKFGRITIATADEVPPDHFSKFMIDDDASQYILLSVSDTGIGIAADVDHEIFEPFYSTKKGEEGSGFGLASVYGMVNQNHGHIRFESHAGELTTFYIYWPKTTPHEISSLKPEQEVGSLQGSGAILLVEDQLNVRKVMNIVLDSLGYNVTAVNTGEEALALIEKGDVDFNLILCDIILPKMSGTDLLKHIIKTNPKIKMLLMSGYPNDDMDLKELLGDNVRFIIKPFTKEKIARSIKDILIDKS